MDATDQTIDLLCPGCGYNLRGIDSPRCPECGITLDWARLAHSRIPWEHRREVGRVRAFLKTVWLVISRPGEIGREVARPVSYQDAQTFRWIVVLCASVPLWAWVVVGQIVWGHNPPGTPSFQPNWSQVAPFGLVFDCVICLYGGVTIWPVPWFAVLLFVAAVSGVASYLFHPREIPMIRQDRAIALSLYSSAPLATMFVPSILFGALAVSHRLGLIDDSRQLSTGMGTLLFLAWLSLMLVPVLLWYGTLRILYLATTHSWSRVVVGAVAVPLCWILLAGLALVLMPMVFGFIRMLVNSYWL